MSMFVRNILCYDLFNRYSKLGKTSDEFYKIVEGSDVFVWCRK